MNNKPMKFLVNNSKYKAKTDISLYSPENAAKVQRYHSSFPQYGVTELVALDGLAHETGLGGIYVKDESTRFGLNAFKVLGGSYAIGMTLAEKLGIKAEELTFSALCSARDRGLLKDTAFITATDGNHGRGVAWTAHELGCEAYVYMPRGTAKERLDNILKTGAHAEITDMTYDDCVRLSSKLAKENNLVLVQDTAFGDYYKIPQYIMQGYITMALEAYNQLGGKKPTHIFVQAGVGSLAAAVTAFFACAYPEDRPKIIIVEADKADCVFETALCDDGKLHPAKGKLDTIMAGLACGEVSELAWPVLRDYADFFVSMEDGYAVDGMRKLAYPCEGDKPVTAGESGASGFSALLGILTSPENKEIKEQLGLNKNSHVLVFNTEGDTDKENYRKIIYGD